jgi:hypothetical protein
MKTTHITGILVSLGLFFADAQAEEPNAPDQRRILQPMDYKGVTLEDGFLKHQLEGVKTFYLSIDDNDLLRGFRRRAGKPAPGKELEGWYSDDLFHIFGQVISGLSRLYAATGDTNCRDKANYLVAEWAQCIAPDGFFFYSDKPKSPHYTYDKMVGGLVDAHLYAHNPYALQHLHKITEWAVKNLDRSRPCPTERNGNADEWYTLSENLYRAYLASGESRPIYREFAKVWEYTDYWTFCARRANLFAEQCDGKPRDYHAYSHVNTLSGAASAYLVTGQPHYLDTIRHAYDFMQTTECFATGGYGPDEHFFPPDAVEAMLSQSHATFETQCGSWAAFKLCKYLISFTGDARYGNWIECLVFNGVGASIPNSKDGRVFYYSDYNPGGAIKGLHNTPWTCCAGTRPCAVADYCDLIYFKDKNGIYVNLFTPSTVRFQANGKPVVLRQETAFPENDSVTFIVQVEQPSEFALKLRKPSWLANQAAATINNKAIELSEDKLHWLSVQRLWHSGDRLQIHFRMSPVVRRFLSGQSKHYAVSVGPVVLAAKAEKNPSTLIDSANLEKSMEPVAKEPMTYKLAGATDVILKPFYQFRPGEKYFLYFASQPPVGTPQGKDPLKKNEPIPKAAHLVLRYVAGSTVKLEQLIGDEDKQTKQPTLSRTFSRFKIRGTDLGYSFEHQSSAYFLFGDTMSPLGGAPDVIAKTDAHDPERGVRLDFLTAPGRPYLAIEPPGISMGAFETPIGGISLGGHMYVIVRTDHNKKNDHDWSKDRAVLTKFSPPAKFEVLRTMSQPPNARFITMSLHHETGAVAGLPPGGPFVFIWGTGWYRKSDAYLAIVPAAHFETGKGTHYFAGLDAAGKPTWSEKEADAKPIVNNGTMGDLSVTWCKNLGLWLMTYDRAKPTSCVAFQYSRTSWGPWSEPQPIFDFFHDGAGKFIHIAESKPPDGLSGPVIGKPEKDWPSTGGGFYAPYVVERFTKVVDSELHLYYCLSTWNPYVVVLMKSRLKIEQGD